MNTKLKNELVLMLSEQEKLFAAVVQTIILLLTTKTSGGMSLLSIKKLHILSSNHYQLMVI